MLVECFLQTRTFFVKLCLVYFFISHREIQLTRRWNQREKAKIGLQDTTSDLQELMSRITSMVALATMVIIMEDLQWMQLEPPLLQETNHRQ